MLVVVFWQVSQKQAARSAEQAKDNISQHASPFQPVTEILHHQQQQHSQQQRSQATSKQPTRQHAIENEERWRPQQTQHVQQDHQPQEPSSKSLQRNESGEDVGMAGVGRGSSPVDGAGVAAAIASNASAVHARPSFPPQVKLCPSSSPGHMSSLSPLPSPFHLLFPSSLP